jgi:hypothetical protein
MIGNVKISAPFFPERTVQQILLNERVRLVEALNELQLQTGEVGVVRSSWHFPITAYEVEFNVSTEPLRLLLLAHQIAPERSN